MKSPLYQEALQAYITLLSNKPAGEASQDYLVKPITGGLINQTFKVTGKKTGKSFILQRINEWVFPDPRKLQRNYESLWKYFRDRRIKFPVPEPGYFPGNSTLFKDSRGKFWRVFEFIPGTKTFSKVPAASIAGKVAETFARFTVSLKDFNARGLKVIIPGFHNLSFRYKQFVQSLETARPVRRKKAAAWTGELKSREHYSRLYDMITTSDDFPLRVMHHDAKISNVLFYSRSGKVAGLIDFDTVMPGYFFSDLGDMIRSMAANRDEAATDFKQIKIRKKFYEALVGGYLKGMTTVFSAAEKKHIHYAGIFMIYMQALRFMTDYLNNDAYYRISYAEQNFDRAVNQVTLLQQLERFLAKKYKMGI